VTWHTLVRPRAVVDRRWTRAMVNAERPEHKASAALYVSHHEQRLLLDEAVLSAELQDKLSLGLHEGDQILLDLTADDLEELLDCVATTAKSCDDPTRQRELDLLYLRAAALSWLMEEGEEEPHPSLPPPLDAVEAIVSLSSHQVRRLISKWEGDRPGVKLNAHLPLAELRGSRILVNARIFLKSVLDAGHVKATVANNLNRAFVHRMLEQLHFGPGFVEDVRRVCKVINEMDVWPLHILRVNLQMARLIARRKGKFVATRKGRELQSEARAGQLYELLFRTFFHTFNLAYLDRLADAYGFQHMIGVSLYALSRCANDWEGTQRLTSVLVHPAVRESLPPRWQDREPVWLARSRLLRPLEDFGLIERRVVGRYWFDELDEIRKTPLFDRFLEFDPGPEEPRRFVFPAKPGVH
jgi:hypothetical protein